MRSFSVLGTAKLALLLAAALAMSACSWFGGGKSSGVVKQADNIPAGFDVTLVAAKDNQFDLNDVPLTPQDLESAFRHRTQEEKQPLTTVLLKRGEKQKVKKEHEANLVRIARQMGFKAYVEDGDGVISELQARGE